jgi:hypothetical protein
MARGCWNFWEQEISTVEASTTNPGIFAGRDNAVCWLCLAATAIVISRETVNTQQLPISAGWGLFLENRGHIPFRRFTYRHVYLFIRLVDEIILDGNRIYRASQSNYCPGKVEQGGGCCDVKGYQSGIIRHMGPEPVSLLIILVSLSVFDCQFLSS